MTAQLSELLGRVDGLELVARRNVTSLRSGAYRSAVVGRGLEFFEARKYVQGESVRQIDWKMTARRDEPWVRRFVEEREREIFLAVDVSPSMYAGWQHRTKLETAVELAATLAVSAVEAHDRLGLICFSDRVHNMLRPQLGRANLYRSLSLLVRHIERGPEACAVSDPRTAIHAIEAHRGRRLIVFLISDFIDLDVPTDVRYLRRRHDVTLLRVCDPLEQPSADSPVRLPARSPEGNDERRWLKLKQMSGQAAMHRSLEQMATAFGITLASVSTRDKVAPFLRRLFLGKQQWMRR